MKRIMLTGASLGFASGLGLGWVRQLPMQDVFWHACVGAYVGGMLMRWYGGVWYRGLRDSYRERLAEAAATAETAENKDATLAGRS